MSEPTERISVGTEAQLEEVVRHDRTIASLREGLPAVYATPAMIMLMEGAAARAIQPLLPEGWISVGTLVNVQHLAPTPVGATVTAQARVTEVAGLVITFEVSAHDGTELIGRGTHQRAAIEVARFMRRVKAKQAV